MAVRVLIVDDSSFFRKRLSEIISSDPNLSVVGTASNGKQGIEQAKKLKPDVITMDVEMPEMDGITATRHIMSHQPTAILILSTWSTQGAKTTLDALEAGAVDFMPKRFEDISSDRDIAQKQLCNRLLHLAANFKKHDAASDAKTITSNDTNKSAKTVISKDTGPTLIDKTNIQAIKLVAIGTSTGGPVALQKLLLKLPASFPHPILIIQHMPATFTPSFAERLNAQCAINVKQASDDESISAGTVYLAPGGRQMLIAGNKNRLYIKLQDSQSDQTYHPCIDITLKSLAQICPAETLAIILTGMGSDGKEGCQALKGLGAIIWSQDEQSSTIYGMPMAIAKARLADKILSLTDIGQQLMKIK